ncbi:MAG: hypothetical protein U1F68_18720 [Gammaproteobacteria bacterium]
MHAGRQRGGPRSRLDPARLVFVDETWASTAMDGPTAAAPAVSGLVMALPWGTGRRPPSSLRCAARAHLSP